MYKPVSRNDDGTWTPLTGFPPCPVCKDTECLYDSICTNAHARLEIYCDNCGSTFGLAVKTIEKAKVMIERVNRGESAWATEEEKNE